jgi:polar amino acid transport system substrate-binding protein
MKSRKKVTVAIAASLMALAFAGCSKSSSDTTVAAEVAETTAAAVAETTAAAEVVETSAAAAAAETTAAVGAAVETTVAAAAPAAGALNAMLPAAIKTAGVVKVGSDLTYPPYEFLADGSDAPIGFDVDYANAVGEKLGVKFVFENSGFDGLIPAVEAGRYDVILSGMTDKAERQAKVDFVDYQTSGFSILVPAGNALGVAKIEDLCGKKVAMQKGTSQIDFVKGVSAKCPTPIEISEFPTEPEAQLAIQSGRADAGVADTPPMAYFVTTTEAGKKFEMVKGEQYEAALLGMAVSKKLPELRDAVQKATAEMIADGSYGKLLTKWGLEATKITEATVNGGK